MPYVSGGPAALRSEASVETVNAGVCGWGTTQELLWLRREGFSYDPDVVVLGFFLNDFADNASSSAMGYRRPVYALEGGRLVLRGVPISGPRSAVMTFALNRMATLRLLVAGWEWFDRGFLRDSDAAPIRRAQLRDHDSVEPPQAEAETGAIIDETRRLCEERGIRFLVLAIPSDCQVRPAAPRACREHDETLYAALIRLCSADGIAVVEPLAALRAAEAAGIPTYSEHWNAAGHRIAARAVAAALLRK